MQTAMAPTTQRVEFRMTPSPLDVENPIEVALIRLMQGQYQGIHDSEGVAPGMSSAIHHIGFGSGVSAR